MLPVYTLKYSSAKSMVDAWFFNFCVDKTEICLLCDVVWSNAVEITSFENETEVSRCSLTVLWQIRFMTVAAEEATVFEGKLVIMTK